MIFFSPPLSSKVKAGEILNSKDVQRIYQLCSYLLNYPSKEYLQSLREVEEEIAEINVPEIKEELSRFCRDAGDKSLNELIATYVYTFDFGKKTNLYVTYMSNGEQRERGMDLLFLKNYYKMHGFAVTDKELPDYLPIILEFAGQVELEVSKTIFERYLTNIKEIETRLNEEENLYGHILRALTLALEKVNIAKPVRKGEVIC